MFIVIGVLPENDHLHLMERSQMQRLKDEVRGRIDHMILILFPDKIIKIPIIRLLELGTDRRKPVVRDCSHRSGLPSAGHCLVHRTPDFPDILIGPRDGTK